jgi:hypothetical protein
LIAHLFDRPLAFLSHTRKEKDMETQTPTFDPAQFINTAAPGRDCGSCTLCCKVYEVPSLAKPANQWCSHCAPGKGCGIWQTRPDHCRAFFCMWMTDARLPAEWKPDKSKFVLTFDPASRYLMVQVDPGAPKAWRQEPYYSQLMTWAKALLTEERLVIVFNNKHGTALLPSGEVDLGNLGPEDRINLELKMTPTGPVYNIVKFKVN